MEHSAGAIIFYEDKKTGMIEYLLLQYPKVSRGEKTRIPNHWDFPKGHIEKGENEIQTVSREVKEETGLAPITIIPAFKERVSYFFFRDGKRIFKEVIFYLAQAKIKKVQLSFEHLDFTWLPFEKALVKVTHKNTKDILRKANEFLARNYVRN